MSGKAEVTNFVQNIAQKGTKSSGLLQVKSHHKELLHRRRKVMGPLSMIMEEHQIMEYRIVSSGMDL